MYLVGNGNLVVGEFCGIKCVWFSIVDDDDDDDEKGGCECCKIEIKFISDKLCCYIIFFKCKVGIMKKVCLFVCLDRVVCFL